MDNTTDNTTEVFACPRLLQHDPKGTTFDLTFPESTCRRLGSAFALAVGHWLLARDYARVIEDTVPQPAYALEGATEAAYDRWDEWCRRVDMKRAEERYPPSCLVTRLREYQGSADEVRPGGPGKEPQCTTAASAIPRNCFMCSFITANGREWSKAETALRGAGHAPGDPRNVGALSVPACVGCFPWVVAHQVEDSPLTTWLATHQDGGDGALYRELAGERPRWGVREIG